MVYIFVPYIKTSVLSKLVGRIQGKIVIVTTWEPKDLLSGSSDLYLYPFCKERGIALYVTEGLHLKVYSLGLNSAILATGNISQRGLLPEGNYEVAIMIDRLTNEDRLFFSKIRNTARLVNDYMYHKLKNWYDTNKTKIVNEPRFSDIASGPERNDFSIASLPMTRSVSELVSGYVNISQGLEPSDNDEIDACIFHDLANYHIELGLSRDEFVKVLALKFFDHPFIRKMDEFISPETYFGRIKEWIQNNCTDVPVPSRRELTGNVQVLLEWFVNLGNGKYVVDVPGSKSQRIRKFE